MPSPGALGLGRGRLGRERIAAVALALIDEVGQQRFTMRRLGAELGVDPMAVYRHLADREAVFDAVAERLFEESDPQALRWEAEWDALLAEQAGRLRGVLQAHPNAVLIFASRPVRSTHAVAVAERTMSILVGAGFDAGRALQALRCVREFTIGHALSCAVELGAGHRVSRRPSPGSADYTLLAEAADAFTPDEHFDLGLKALIDGLGRLAR